MLRNLLRLEQPFYIARQERAPLLRERKRFWSTCFSRARALRRHAVCHGNC